MQLKQFKQRQVPLQFAKVTAILVAMISKMVLRESNVWWIVIPTVQQQYVIARVIHLKMPSKGTEKSRDTRAKASTARGRP